MANQNRSGNLGKNQQSQQDQQGRGVETPTTTGAGETSTSQPSYGNSQDQGQRKDQSSWSSGGMKQQGNQTRNIDK